MGDDDDGAGGGQIVLGASLRFLRRGESRSFCGLELSNFSRCFDRSTIITRASVLGRILVRRSWIILGHAEDVPLDLREDFSPRRFVARRPGIRREISR